MSKTNSLKALDLHQQFKCQVSIDGKPCGNSATAYELGKGRVKASFCNEHLHELLEWVQVLKKGGRKILLEGQEI